MEVKARFREGCDPQYSYTCLPPHRSSHAWQEREAGASTSATIDPSESDA